MLIVIILKWLFTYVIFKRRIIQGTRLNGPIPSGIAQLAGLFDLLVICSDHIVILYLIFNCSAA